MNEDSQMQVELIPYSESMLKSEYDLDRIIYDFDTQINLLSSQADKFDYLVSIGSGLLCGLLDVLQIGDFSLEHGRNIASNRIDDFVIKTAKLLVSVREIFLNDEHDIDYSDSIYEQYVQSIMDIEKGLVELKLEADIANGKEKKELKRQIKNAKESVEAMKIARKSLLKFKNSFEEDYSQE